MPDSPPSALTTETTGRAIGVFLLAIASLIAYLIFSPAVRMVSAQLTYLNSVLGSFAQSPSLRTFNFAVAPQPLAILTFVVFCASCIAIGVLVWQSMRGHRAAVPLAWTGGLAAAIVPTLVFAIVGWPDGAGSIRNVWICVGQLVLLALVWYWFRSAHHRMAVPLTDEFPGDDAFIRGDEMAKWLRPLLLLSALYVVAILICGFSGIFGYDSFSDHLVVPARWLISGRLERGLPEEIVTFYPGNFELLVRWTQSLGSDRFAFLLSLGSGIASVWVVFRIARELGQTKTAATISALAAAALPVLAYQGIVVYSDTFTALCLLLATWLLLVFAREEHRTLGLSFGFGVALGLALGAKYSAGPPAVVLGTMWVFFTWKESWAIEPDKMDRLQWRQFGRHLVWMSAGVMPPMAYWYVYNAVTMHNPLYPLSVVGLPGIDIGALLAGAPGPKTTVERITWFWTEFAHGPGFETGLGPIYATFAVIAVCTVPFLRRRPGSQIMLAWCVLVLSAIAWWRTGVLVTRYGLFPLLLSFVFVGELWSTYRSRTFHALFGALFGIVVSVTMLSVGHEMVGGAAYNELMFDPSPQVPAVVDELPPSRILNAVGQPAGYYLRGRDQRHHVYGPFQIVTADYVRGLAPDYVLIPEVRESEFVQPLSLELMGRWTKDGQASTSLWKVP